MTQVTLNIDGEETTFENVMFTILSAGYGHNKVTCHFTHPKTFELISHSKVTSDTRLTDAMRDDDDYERYEEARQGAAIWLIEDYFETNK